jgi:hypothetical protein
MNAKNVIQYHFVCGAGRLWGFLVLMSSIAFQAFPQEPTRGQDWAPLIQAANAISLANPMLLRDTPEAAALRERVVRAYENGDIAGLSSVMRAHPPMEQAGQVIAESLAVSVRYSPERIDDLATLFMASLAWPHDGWYDFPRGHVTSDTFRSDLGGKVLGLLTGKGAAADPAFSRVNSQPSDWLREHLEAARGKFGTEVEAALVRALKVIAETPPALRNPLRPGQVIEPSNTRQTPKLPAVKPDPSTKTSKEKTWPQEEGVTSEKVSTWVMIPTALAAIGLLWLLLKKRK